MSNSNADDAARKVLRIRVQHLDNDIAQFEKDVAEYKSAAIRVAAAIDKLKRERTALSDAIHVHFPVATW